MAGKTVAGYNIGLKLATKTIIGRTQDDLDISALTKESITKDDAGVKNVAVTGHDITFSVSALLKLTEASTTELGRDEILDMALKTGDTAVYAFTYACGNGKSLTGNCIITGYKESSSADADSDSTISITCKTTGPVTFGK